MKPTIGRIVIYRSRTGDYDVPAIINATVDTLNRKGVEAGYVPDLSSAEHVHLTVLSPGMPGLRKTGEHTDFKVVSKHPVSENVSGCYQEWDIPQWFTPEITGGPDIPASPPVDPEPGSWRWPELVS